MESYSAMQWLLFFYIYCFLGWCFESAYVSICQKQLVNRGFMRGPFLPIYGSGAIMMLFASMPFHDNIVLVYVSGMVGATILEYITGVIMEALFKVRYWDYSNKKFNYKGHICLSSSIAWGFLTILMTEVIHKPIADVVLAMPERLFVAVTFLLTVIIAADFSLSFKTAMELRAELVSMEKLREEFRILQKRLDVVIAFADESCEEKKQEREARTEELVENIREKLEAAKERLLVESLEDKLSEIQAERLEKYREEIVQLREKFHESVGKWKSHHDLSGFYRKHMILGNPTMVSEKFRAALEELKETLKKAGKDEQ